MDPAYADGWVNVARAQLQEGNVAGADRDARSRRSTIDPQLAKTHFFLGTALKTLGRYDEALDAPAHAPRRSIRATASCSIRSAACCSSQRQFDEAIARVRAGAARSIPRTCRRTTT